MAISQPIVVGIDAGGTMTDTILVDERGHFKIGKAATTPPRWCSIPAPAC